MKKMLLLLALFFSYFSYSQQVQKSLTAANGSKIGFYQYTPVDYNPAVKYPLIIFLHGSGEVGNGGSDLSKVLNNGIPKLINQGADMKFTVNGETKTFLVLCPQLDSKYGNWQDFYADEMLKYAKANLSIDENRIYLTGLSLGGGGTWAYSSSDTVHTAQFAAISPIAATGETQQYFCWLTKYKVAIWAFHDMDDPTVPVGNTQYAQMTLDNCDPGHTEVRQFTYYPSGGHNAWDRAYDMGHGVQNPNLYEFFLMNPKVQAVPVTPVADAGKDQVLNYPTNSAVLDGSKSYDPSGGTIVSYKWSVIEGAKRGDILSPNTPTTTVDNLTKGVHGYILTVTNDKGMSSNDVVLVGVKGDPAANVAPLTEAGKDTTISAPSDSAYLDGVDSYDPDGLIVVFNWKKISGPAGEMIADSSKRRTLVKGLKPGTYWFKLTTGDIYNASSYDSVKITVLPPPSNNKPPVANAGGDFTTSDNFAYLSGGASYDPDGKITAYLWTQVSGPNTATLISANTVFPTAQGLVAGNYAFKLTVTDNYGVTDDDTVVCTVLGSNKPPVANAGPDQTIQPPATTAWLDGSMSSDPDGTLASYEWSKISGPAGGDIDSAWSAKTQISNLVAGVYVYELKVTDDKGVTATDQVKINVGGNNNKPPVANAGGDFSTKDNFVYLSAGASYDPDGSISSFMWTQVSGPNTANVLSGNTMFPTVNGIIPGTYVFKVTVTDNGGASDDDDVSFTVAPTTPPVLDVPDSLIVTLPASGVTLNALGSYAPDGKIVSFKWERVGGNITPVIVTPTVGKTNISNLTLGFVLVKLTATDNRGTSVSKVIKIIVSTNRPPVAKAGFDFVSANNYVYLSAGGSYDLDGHIVSFKWTQAVGPAGATIWFDNTMFPTVVNIVPGVYVFKLVVTDDGGFSTSDYVTVVTIPRNDAAVDNTLVATIRPDQSALAIQSGTLSLYPNPAVSTLKLALNNKYTGKVSVTVVDAMGKVQMVSSYNKPAADFLQQMDVSRLSQGVYYMQVSVNGQGTTVKKFIKL